MIYILYNHVHTPRSSSCGPGSAGPARSGRRGYRAQVHEDRGGHLRLHQPQHTAGEARSSGIYSADLYFNFNFTFG